MSRAARKTKIGTQKTIGGFDEINEWETNSTKNRDGNDNIHAYGKIMSLHKDT
jgi:hypothetical protein